MFDSVTKVVMAVPDAGPVVELYTETFGGELVSQDDREQWGIKITLIEVGNCVVEVMSPMANDTREGFVLSKKSLFGVTLTVSREK